MQTKCQKFKNNATDFGLYSLELAACALAWLGKICTKFSKILDDKRIEFTAKFKNKDEPNDYQI